MFFLPKERVIKGAAKTIEELLQFNFPFFSNSKKKTRLTYLLSFLLYEGEKSEKFSLVLRM